VDVEGRNDVSLNIKNEPTCQLIGELARLTGESMTGAVEEAVRQRLERVFKRGDFSETDVTDALTGNMGPNRVLRFKPRKKTRA
jgi:hypothetical protein